MLRMTMPAIRVYLFCILLPLLLAGCGKEEGYEIRDGKVIWHSWRGDGLSGLDKRVQYSEGCYGCDGHKKAAICAAL